MKKSQQHSIIAVGLLSALLALSPAASADDVEARHVKQRNAVDPDPVFWTVSPINKRWNTPPKHDVWTIPSTSKQWSNPMPALQWTIPRSAVELQTPDE